VLMAMVLKLQPGAQSLPNGACSGDVRREQMASIWLRSGWGMSTMVRMGASK